MDVVLLQSKITKMKQIILFSFVIFSAKMLACSSFFFNSGSKLLAKNFDWYSGEGYILKNQKGQKKFAYGFKNANVASWTSKYGSVTFNQNGKEFPYGGMNERGLVVEQLWLSSSEYQENNNQNISELEWIQYQLDNFQSVQEIIENINSLTIKPVSTVHYMIADKRGNSTVIEYIDGKVRIDQQISRYQVITNETSEDSKKYFELNKNIKPESRTHFDRYCILENSLSKLQNLNPNLAFGILDTVKENRGKYKTFWSIVYDLDKGEIYLQSYENQNTKKISMPDFNFNLPCEYSEINTNQLEFKNYTNELNLELLSKSLKVINIKMDEILASNHQMNPHKIVQDYIYQKNYTDLLVEFSTKKNGGNIYFMFTKDNMNNGFLMGVTPATGNITRKILYNFPKGEFALKCFQDLNLDGKIDKNIFGIPIRTGFSNNKKKIFGIPPDYKYAKINIKMPMTIYIKLK